MYYDESKQTFEKMALKFLRIIQNRFYDKLGVNLPPTTIVQPHVKDRQKLQYYIFCVSVVVINP